MKKPTSNEVKQFYNKHFFEGKEAIGAGVQVSFTIGEQTIEMNFSQLRPGHSVHEMFTSFYESLTADEKRKEKYLNGNKPGKEKLVDIEKIGYKGNMYLVEKRGDDDYIVRKEDGKVLSEKSPTTKSIIKIYKEAEKR